MAVSVIDQLVRTPLDGMLRVAGFRRKGRVWNRSREHLVDVVDLQSSKWNTAADQSLAVNLGVFAPSVYRVCWQKEPPPVAREEDCLVRRRLSHDLESQVDQWWTIRDARDLETAGAEIVSLLSSNAIPFFDRLGSLSAIREALEATSQSRRATPLDRIYLAIVKAELGDLDGAMTILGDIRTSAPSAWSDRVSIVIGALSGAAG
jgi:hypothetical protein